MKLRFVLPNKADSVHSPNVIEKEFHNGAVETYYNSSPDGGIFIVEITCLPNELYSLVETLVANDSVGHYIRKYGLSKVEDKA